jgi:virginiamycin B lyase
MHIRFSVVAVLCLALSACSESPPQATQNVSSGALPLSLIQSNLKRGAGTFTFYKAPSAATYIPENLVVGPDGNFWYPTQVTVKKKTVGAIIRFTPKGVATTFVIPSSGSISVDSPASITVGSDGNIWFGSYDCTIGSISTAGVFQQEYTLGSDSCDLTVGSSTSATGVWFTNGGSTNYVGYITTSGSVVQYQLPNGSILNGGNEIVLGSDGNLWFTEGINGDTNIGRVTPNGVITLFPSSANNSTAIVAGPDGNLWYTGGSGTLGVMNTSGQVVATYEVGNAYNLTNGSDGNIWIAEGNANPYSGLERVTPAGTITTFAFPKSARKYRPFAIVTGPDSNMWFTAAGDGDAKDPKGMGTFAL